MGMVILGLEAILIPVGRIVSIRQMERYAEGSRIAKELLNFTDMHPLLVLLSLIHICPEINSRRPGTVGCFTLHP